MMSRRQLLAFALVALLAAPLVVGAGGSMTAAASAGNTATATPTPTPDPTQTPTQTQTPTPASSTTATPAPTEASENASSGTPALASSSEFNLSELKQNGKRFDTKSVRLIRAEKITYWVEYRPSGQPWRGSPAESTGEFLSPDKTVKVNTIYLKSWVFEPRTVNLTLVFWQRGTREIAVENGTIERPAAVNVTVVHRELSMSPGKAAVAIDLPRHPEARQVTMWVKGHEQNARWRFQHRSVATTQPIAINTWGDFIAMGAGLFLIPTAVGSAISARKVRQWMKEAQTGPQWGLSKWVGIILGLSIVVAFGAYTQLVEAIVYVPVLASGVLVAIIAAFMLSTHERDIGHVLLLKPTINETQGFGITEAVENDDGEVVEQREKFQHDIVDAQVEQRKVAKQDDGLAFIREGLLAFWARRHGASAPLENEKNLRTRIDLSASPWDEIFIVDPDWEPTEDYEQGLMAYRPEGWEFNVFGSSGESEDENGDGNSDPVTWKDMARVAGGLGIPAVIIGGAVFSAIGLTGGLLAGGVVAGGLFWRRYAEPIDGYAYIEGAPFHTRQAWASTLMMAEGHDAAKTIKALRRKVIEGEVSSQQEIQEALENEDATVLKEIVRFVRNGNGAVPTTDDGGPVDTPAAAKEVADGD